MIAGKGSDCVEKDRSNVEIDQALRQSEETLRAGLEAQNFTHICRILDVSYAKRGTKNAMRGGCRSDVALTLP